MFNNNKIKTFVKQNCAFYPQGNIIDVADSKISDWNIEIIKLQNSVNNTGVLARSKLEVSHFYSLLNSIIQIMDRYEEVYVGDAFDCNLPEYDFLCKGFSDEQRGLMSKFNNGEISNSEYFKGLGSEALATYSILEEHFQGQARAVNNKIETEPTFWKYVKRICRNLQLTGLAILGILLLINFYLDRNEK